MVRAVKRSRERARNCSNSAGGRWAGNTSPDETACIGMRVPVQSRTATGWGLSTWST